MIKNKDRVPDWAKRSVGYICFVDSFASKIPKKDHLYSEAIYGEKLKRLSWHEKDDTLHHSFGYYGGDLNGISESAEYFKDLGIDFVYLSPVFEAASNHKYDTLNYLKIDQHFGSLEDFKNLVSIFKMDNIKIILDGVFNHTSSEHEWHIKAKKGIKKYINYYKTNEDDYIIVWNGIETLPVLNHDNPDVRKYFYDSDDSVVQYWLKLGIAGWRLDVAERLGEKVLRDIRKSIKSKYPDAHLVGEVVETYGKEWLQDGLLDGAMNYVFRGVTANFLTGKIDGLNYMDELVKMYNEYPKEKLLASWNILSTHDTNRMLFDLNNNEGMFKIAGILQFTYPGVPVIYYGDELGTSLGEKEVNNRVGMDWDCVKSYKGYIHNQPMPWEKFDRYNSYHQFFKHLIWLRKNFRVLSEGDFIQVHSSDDVIAFIRNIDDKYMFTIVNRGMNQSVKITIPEKIAAESPVLNCRYGGNTPFHLNKTEIDFYIGAKNAYIFMN